MSFPAAYQTYSVIRHQANDRIGLQDIGIVPAHSGHLSIMSCWRDSNSWLIKIDIQALYLSKFLQLLYNPRPHIFVINTYPH